MSDLQAIKLQIYEDSEVARSKRQATPIENLLSALGCENIHEEQNGDLIVAQLPPRFNSDNTRSIQVKLTETLPSTIRSRGVTGDIFSIVGYILYEDECRDFEGVKTKLHHIVTFVCNELGYEHFLKRNQKGKDKSKKDWNGWLRDIKKRRHKEIEPEQVGHNQVLSESILNDYIPYGHHLFLRDGISFYTQHQFEVKYDLWSDRIVFPVRNRYGQLIGVKGRYAGTDKHIMDEQKYLYLHPCDKSVELFNLHRALPHIQKQKSVIVVEGAKSCMLLTQWGYPNCVSIEGNTLTPIQAMLLRDLGVQIIFAWDYDIYYPKDVFNLEFIQRQIRQIKNRVINVIIDTEGLLQDHDSPTDRGKAVWDRLYKEHQQVMTGV